MAIIKTIQQIYITNKFTIKVNVKCLENVNLYRIYTSITENNIFNKPQFKRLKIYTVKYQ